MSRDQLHGSSTCVTYSENCVFGVFCSCLWTTVLGTKKMMRRSVVASSLAIFGLLAFLAIIASVASPEDRVETLHENKVKSPEDETISDKIVSQIDQPLKFEVPEVPDDQINYEKTIRDEETEAGEKAHKDLTTASHNVVQHWVATNLEHNHDGSVVPSSPEYLAKADTDAAQSKASQAVNKRFRDERMATMKKKHQAKIAAANDKHAKFMKDSEARQDAWNKAAKKKEDAAKAKHEKDARDHFYDSEVEKRWKKKHSATPAEEVSPKTGVKPPEGKAEAKLKKSSSK